MQCKRLECPNPISPRSMVALPRCISRAFSTIASYSGNRWNLRCKWAVTSKRTFGSANAMSANDPLRTSAA